MKKTLLFVIALSLAPVASFAQSTMIVSKLGGKCLDVEGGVRIGARLIGYECHGGTNQQLRFDRGRLVVGGYCAQADHRSEGSEVRLAQCNFTGSGDSLQNFASWEGKYIGHNTGYVLDLKGGSGHWWGNQPVILWTKKGSSNQLWMKGEIRQASMLTTFTGSVMAPGKLGVVSVSGGRAISENGAGVISTGPNGLITDNGAGIIAARPLN